MVEIWGGGRADANFRGLRIARIASLSKNGEDTFPPKRQEIKRAKQRKLLQLVTFAQH